MNVHSACGSIGIVQDKDKGGYCICEGYFALQHSATPRERTVAAAKKLFAERGFHSTAMADLADEAKVSVGTIYRSFAGKSEIIRAIVQADTEEVLGRLQTTIDLVRRGGISGHDAIETLVLEWVSARNDALNHEIVAEGHRNPAVAEVITTLCSQYRERLRTILSLFMPHLDETELEGGAELLLACLFGMGNRAFTRPRLGGPDTAAIVTTLILRGLRSAES